ncbi:MAG TPA: tripartite tricarboxylate transporter substrate binding protein [Burkholderiales bacterium]|nr:tripartite tricarboxylate transporter substrate binding protein [Burkholderiales bacterium]
MKHLFAVFVGAVMLIAGIAHAQSSAAGSKQGYPLRPVRLITPVTAGSAVDTVARVIGQKLADSWGQQVVVDNRVGANGIIGTEAAARSAPDGYTLYLGNDAVLAINPSMYRKLPYDPVRDFVPVMQVANIPLVLIVHPSLPVKTVRELIALAKAHPGELNYASGGNGSPQHIPMEMLKAAAHVDIVHVPYKGLGPAFNDVLGGQVPMMFAGMSNVVPHARNGRLRILAVGGVARSAALPDVPTVAEAGVPGFAYAAWTGFLVPAGVPQDIVVRLHGEFAGILKLPDVRERLTNLGFELVGGTPGEFSALLRSDIARMEKVVRGAGIRAD